MENSLGKTEELVESIRAYCSGVKGCIKHERDIMISYINKDGDIIDLFLNQDVAKNFRDELSKKIKDNEEA